MAPRPPLADPQLARPTLAAEAEGYAPQTRRYRPPLSFRPPRRFGDSRREPRERWIA
jgi:hypothetical protein